MLADQPHPWYGMPLSLFGTCKSSAWLFSRCDLANARLQQKVDRYDVSSDELVQEVFQEAPAEPGKARLRIAGTGRCVTARCRQLPQHAR